jgi:hypothetical protein
MASLINTNKRGLFSLLGASIMSGFRCSSSGGIYSSDFFLVRDPANVLLSCVTFLFGWSSGPGPLFDDVVSASAATGSGGFASAIGFARLLIFTGPDCFAVAIAFAGVGSGAGVADCFVFSYCFCFCYLFYFWFG